MQTISVPYRCSDEDRSFLDDLRRVQSASIRTAYVNALSADGCRAKEMDLRNLVKARFADEGLLDSWAIQCATKLGIWKRKATPNGMAIFSGRAEFERRRKRLISRDGMEAQEAAPIRPLRQPAEGARKPERPSRRRHNGR